MRPGEAGAKYTSSNATRFAVKSNVLVISSLEIDCIFTGYSFSPGLDASLSFGGVQPDMIIIPTKGTILIEDQQAATLPGLLRCSSTIISKHPYLCQGVFEETLLQEHDF